MSKFARRPARIVAAFVFFCMAPQAVAQGASSVALYHLYDGRDRDSFYTTSASEEGALVRARTYVYDGIIGYASSASAIGTAPVFRLFNPATGEHFYTVSAAERASVISNLHYQDQGIAFSVLTAAGPGTVPLYRLYSPSWQRHFYTTDGSQRLALLQRGWTGEGTLGSLDTTPQTTPAAPTGLKAAGVWVPDCPLCRTPMAHILLSWDAAPGASGYRVFRDGTPLAVVATPAYTDMSVTSGQSYTYTVCAQGAGGDGPPSLPATATAPAAPSTAPVTALTPPTNLAAHGVWQGGPTDVLSWDAVPGASSYNVYQYGQPIVQGVTGTTYTVPLSRFNGSMTYTVTAVRGGMESIPSAIAGARGANNPGLRPSWTPNAPVTPSLVTASTDWNNGAPRILLSWRGDDADSSYNVYRDGVKVATDLWRLCYVDNNVRPGEMHTYTVTGVNIPWSAPVQSAPSAPVMETAVRTAPAPSSVPVHITAITPDDDSVLVSFDPVPGAVDYRVSVAGVPGSVKYSGGGLSIEENGLDPTLNNSLVVEAVDKLGPFQTMDGGPGPGATPMAGMTNLSINGQGDPSDVPNVLATSGPFPVTVQPFLLAGAQAFQDDFRDGETFSPSPDLDPAVAALSSSFFEINEVQNTKWRIRTYGADTAMSKVFVMGDHLMDTLYDGPTAATHPFSHNNNASLVMMPRATADISGGKVLHVTYEVDGHLDGRRWCDVFVAPAGDSLLVPGKFSENDQLPDTSGNLFRWETHSGTDDAQVFFGQNGTLQKMELFDLANGVGADDFGPGVRTTWDGVPVLNGTHEDLDKRHRFDLYLSQTHFRIVETPLGSAPVVIKDETFPNGITLPFTDCQVYFVHQLYHTGNDRPENIQNNFPDGAYWYNNRPWSDERHWDDCAFEVLPTFPD